MLRTLVIYEGDGYEMPIIETREPEVARQVAEYALREYEESLDAIANPVWREIISSETDQVLRVLRAAGLEV